MRETQCTANPCALIQYAFFSSNNADDDSCYRLTEGFVQKAVEALALSEKLAAGADIECRWHSANPDAGHELVWMKAHEGEAVVLGVGRPPQADTAATVWKAANEILEPVQGFLSEADPLHQGQALALVGLGEAQMLKPIAEKVLGRLLTLSAEAPWGCVWAADLQGPFLVAITSGHESEGERFVSWEELGYALYNFTKGLSQWNDYQKHRKDLAQGTNKATELARKARALIAGHSEEPSHAETRLDDLTSASGAVGLALEPVTRAGVNIKKARVSLGWSLQNNFSNDNGLLAGMRRELLEREEILVAEASVLHEQSAEINRMTWLALGRMQLESARRSNELLAAAHLVEFFVVFYYSLAAWEHIAGEHEFEKIPWCWKLIWAFLISGSVVFATFTFIKKGKHGWALLIGIAVLFLAVAVAAALHEWLAPLAH